MILISKFIPLTPPPPISFRDQIQAANPSLRNSDKIKFLNLFPIYIFREIVPAGIQKC